MIAVPGWGSQGRRTPGGQILTPFGETRAYKRLRPGALGSNGSAHPAVGSRGLAANNYRSNIFRLYGLNNWPAGASLSGLLSAHPTE
jgi:hypothetical protein